MTTVKSERLDDENKNRWISLHNKSTQHATRTRPCFAIQRILDNKSQIKSTSERRETLEVGCGFGRNILFLMENHFCDAVYGVDQSPVAITNCRDLMSGYIERGLCSLSEMDVGRGLNFEDEKFDCIFDIMSAITFIPTDKERDRYWSEIPRVLKPGGTYMFLTVRAEGESQIADKLQGTRKLAEGLFQRQMDGMIEKSYSRPEILSRLKGLEEVELTPTSEHIRAFGDEYFNRKDGFWFGIFRKPLK